MNDPDPQKPRIIIDEDWKSQVEEEKEALQRDDSGASEKRPESADQSELSPASFAAHVMALATQATAALGQMPDPEHPDQQPVVQLDFASYIIDTLAVLEEKTQGNLTAEEAAILENVLHQLRCLFVQLKR